MKAVRLEDMVGGCGNSETVGKFGGRAANLDLSLEDADNTHPNLEGGPTGDCFLLHKFCWSDSNLGFIDRHT